MCTSSACFVSMHVFVDAQCVHVCEVQKATLGIIPQVPSTCLRHGLWLSWSLPSCLTGQLARSTYLPVPVSPVLELQTCHHTWLFKHGFWEPNSGHLACTANINWAIAPENIKALHYEGSENIIASCWLKKKITEGGGGEGERREKGGGGRGRRNNQGRHYDEKLKTEDFPQTLSVQWGWGLHGFYFQAE